MGISRSMLPWLMVVIAPTITQRSDLNLRRTGGTPLATVTRESSNMQVPFLDVMNSLAKAAHSTNDSDAHMLQLLSYMGVTAADKGLTDQLSRRLASAESRYRASDPHTTREADIAEAFNTACRELPRDTDCAEITGNDVHRVRLFFSQISPDLFQTEKEYCSPIESIALLIIFAGNDGHFDGTGIIQNGDSNHVSGALARVQMRSGSVSITSALQAKAANMTVAQLSAWIDSYCRTLKL
jgi:hypothetical protein